MSRFVVRYRGKGAAPAAVVERAGRTPGMRVIDRAPRTLLVEGTAETVQAVFADGDEWVVTAERLYTMPDPRPKVEKKRGSARKGNSP